MPDDVEQTDALPFPEAATAEPNTPEEPQAVADEFLAAAQESADESGATITTAKRRSRGAGRAEPAAAPGPELPKWTPEGIGTAVTFAANFGLIRADMEPLEPEETEKVKIVSAMYLNYRLPKAAAVQPEVMIIALLAEILGPRLAAKAALRKQTEGQSGPDRKDALTP